MRNGIAVHSHFYKTATSQKLRFLNGLGYFGSLSGTDTHAALAVTHDDKRGKTHISAAFYNLGNTVDGDEFAGKTVIRLNFFTFSSCHDNLLRI